MCAAVAVSPPFRRFQKTVSRGLRLLPTCLPYVSAPPVQSLLRSATTRLTTKASAAFLRPCCASSPALVVPSELAVASNLHRAQTPSERTKRTGPSLRLSYQHHGDDSPGR